MAGIALYNQDGLHVEEMWQSNANHTVELMPYIVRACDQQGIAATSLGAVGISIGPGSFTGLRVGLSVAKGLALVLDIPVFGVPTLDATAYAHARSTVPVCAVLPAGRGRWCVAFYQTDAGNWQRCSDYTLMSTKELTAAMPGPVLVCGEMTASLIKELRDSTEEYVVIASQASAARRAGYLAELAWQRFAAGEADDLTSLSPIYLEYRKTDADHGQ